MKWLKWVIIAVIIVVVVWIIVRNKNAEVGYVIVNDSTIYFIAEEKLPTAFDWDNIPLDDFGHPADLILQGEAVDKVRNDLSTGDKVKVWVIAVAESYPGQASVMKIKKL